ncbi:MAG: NTP transferase domain-containing protein [Promethearchaeota archaeon]
MSLQKNNVKNKLSIIILCAGRGTRLKKITKRSPKPLIKIFGIPIIQNTLTSLKRFDINQIAIVIGYLADKIVKFISKLKIEDQSFYNKLQLIDATSHYKSGPLYSFLSVTRHKDFFIKDQYFLVIPGDTIFEYQIFQEIFSIFVDNFNIVKISPVVFYRNIGINRLKEYYGSKRLISHIDIELNETEVLLKKILQTKLNKILSNNNLNQLIPIFILPYKFIKIILDSRKKILYNTIWETLNYFLKQNMRIFAFKLNNEYNFYDIDYKHDIKKREKDNRRSNYSKYN